MNTRTLIILFAAGAAAYFLTRSTSGGSSVLSSGGGLLNSLKGLFTSPVDIPTNGTNAGTTSWTGTTNTSSTPDGPFLDPSEYSTADE